MHTTWTHCNVDIKILTKRSLDKADVDAINLRIIPLTAGHLCVQCIQVLYNLHTFYHVAYIYGNMYVYRNCWLVAPYPEYCSPQLLIIL